MDNVLGLARTGLILTRSQEGTQPSRLTQPGQTGQGIRYHVLSCWVLLGGERGGGKSVAALEARAAVGSETCSVHSAVCFVCSPYQYCCCYFSLCLLFCYTALIPTRQFFACFLLLSSPLQQGREVGRAAAWPFVAGHGQTRRRLHNWAASLYPSQDTCPCFLCWCISFLLLRLTSRSELRHSGLFFPYLISCSQELRAHVLYRNCP